MWQKDDLVGGIIGASVAIIIAKRHGFLLVRACLRVDGDLNLAVGDGLTLLAAFWVLPALEEI